MRQLGERSERMDAGEVPWRIGDHLPGSLFLDRKDSTRAGGTLTPAGFVAPLPSRAIANPRGLDPHFGPII